MKSRVLVIYKKSTYQRYAARFKHRLEELAEQGDRAVTGLKKEHEIHQSAIETTKVALRKLGVKATFRYRPDPAPDDGWDLIVTLGGDGTLLWASHLADSKTPMVAINSAPDTSVGYFCAGDATAAEEVLSAALTGGMKGAKLARMRVDIGGETISTRVLNDLLFCHESPAATTRYVIEHEGVSEVQLSSGIWTGPAAGSTAAIRSAGGKVLPIGSQKLQFAVREPYRGVDNRYKLTKGIINPGDALRVRCEIPRGRIFLDGAQKTFPVGIGDEMRMTLSDEPLTLLGLTR